MFYYSAPIHTTESHGPEPLLFYFSVLMYPVSGTPFEKKLRIESMKKTSILTVSARLAVAVSLFASSTSGLQASTFGIIAGDTSSTMLDDAVNGLRKQLQDVDHMTSEVIGLVNDDHLADPIALDGFDYTEVGAKLIELGFISNVDTFNRAAETIEAKGVIGFCEELKVEISKFDQLLAKTDRDLSAWARLDDDKRTEAILGNSDTNVMPALAKLQTATAQFHSFAQAGWMIFAELSYRDQPGTTSMTGYTATIEQPEPADA